jgi:hypothetical protein
MDDEPMKSIALSRQSSTRTICASEVLVQLVLDEDPLIFELPIAEIT